MGVPGIIAWLYKNHSHTNFIFKTLFKQNAIHKQLTDNLTDTLRVDHVKHLLIDTNCLIHPQTKIICDQNTHLIGSNNYLLEKKIINQVIKYISTLINQTNPTNTIYIAIDGVAPMAKIKHQRLRRFKSVYDRKQFEKIAKKHNVKLPNEYNTNSITPGTEFMDKLMKQILLWIKKTTFNCKIIFSSSYTCGEGEHKILQYLKTLDKSSVPVVIYGLDADLLFLSLASSYTNIYLMRESDQMTINNNNEPSQTQTQTQPQSQSESDEFSYLSIDVLKSIIENEITNKLNTNTNTKNIIYDSKRTIIDFVFLCYFCGNDFLPNIPSLSIKPHNNSIPNGLDTIINAYYDTMENINFSSNCAEPKYLINITKQVSNIQDVFININAEILIKLLEILSDQEQTYYHDYFNNKRYIRRCQSNNYYQIEKYNYESNIIKKYDDQIQLGNPKLGFNEYRRRYYKTYFNIDVDSTNPNDASLNNVLEEYLKGMIWTTYYYFDKCKDWQWYYLHHHGPFISDLKNYLLKNNNMPKYEKLYSINCEWFKNQIGPSEQLLMVLPRESSYLVQPLYRSLMYCKELQEYFMDDIMNMKIDYLGKNKMWQNIPMIKIIPPFKVINLRSSLFDTTNIDAFDNMNKRLKEYIKNV